MRRERGQRIASNVVAKDRKAKDMVGLTGLMILGQWRLGPSGAGGLDTLGNSCLVLSDE